MNPCRSNYERSIRLAPGRAAFSQCVNPRGEMVFFAPTPPARAWEWRSTAREGSTAFAASPAEDLVEG